MRRFSLNQDLKSETYTNPILYLDYSDPDAIRVGDDYYMTASSFTNTPGLPILHSRNLVNWQVVGYALNNVPEERYIKPVHGCGVWAPSIRYHEGLFYICFPMPDEGIYMITAQDARGPWSQPKNIKPGAGYIDPCPFWDEDGRAYLVYGVAKSRIGYKSVLYISEMAPDGMSLIGPETKVFDGNENGQETTEGPKLYKRNGYYYIFAPAGGVKIGWQLAMRSRNIYGPYEFKIIMEQGDTDINGPHQGAWVDTAGGEDWFLHFQDVYSAGRIINLEPMHWENDWPVIGQPVREYKKPTIATEILAGLEAVEPETSDEFPAGVPNTAWQWNANHVSDWIVEDGRPGLTLRAVQAEPGTAIGDYPNILMQKWPYKEFTVDTTIDLSGLDDGDSFGVINMGMDYGVLQFTRQGNAVRVEFIEGSQSFGNILVDHTEEKITRLSTLIFSELNEVKVTERVQCTGTQDLNDKEKGFPMERVNFSYSINGLKPVAAGSIIAKPGRWVGAKNGFYAVGTGKVCVNSVIYS